MTHAMTAISTSWHNVLIVELAIALAVFGWLRWRRAAVWLAVAMTGSLVLDLALKIRLPSARGQRVFWHSATLLQLSQRTRAVFVLLYGVWPGR